MPMRLEGSCRCGAVSFSVDSHTPYPYQRCYCSICLAAPVISLVPYELSVCHS